MSAEAREKFDYDLVAPFPGQAKRVTDEDLQADADAFMAAMGQRQKG